MRIRQMKKTFKKPFDDFIIFIVNKFLAAIGSPNNSGHYRHLQVSKIIRAGIKLKTIVYIELRQQGIGRTIGECVISLLTTADFNDIAISCIIGCRNGCIHFVIDEKDNIKIGRGRGNGTRLYGYGNEGYLVQMNTP